MGFQISDFLAQVASTIESKQFVSVKDAKLKSVMSTGEDASWAIMDKQPTFTEAHVALANTALAWIRGYDGDNTFLKGLRTASQFDEIGVGTAERCAWIVPAYLRNTQEASPEGFGADSKFVGVVGQEHAFRGVVSMVRTVNTKYGPKQIITLCDSDQNVFTYWPSNRTLPVKGGDTVRVFGKVKAHSVYNGVKQNVLTRATIRVVA